MQKVIVINDTLLKSIPPLLIALDILIFISISATSRMHTKAQYNTILSDLHKFLMYFIIVSERRLQ